MKIKAKIWIVGYFIIVVGILGMVGGCVVKIDPFFHYHRPDTEKYFYLLNNERSQNNGILRNFEYDALITGTSMTENFRTTEMDSIFGVNSVKVPFSGGPYKEINDNLVNALAYNPNLKTIVRGLDMTYFFHHKDRTVKQLPPAYLYDNNIFNDVQYIFNRDVIFKRVYTMLKESDMEDFVPGMTDFDTYSNWMWNYKFGRVAVRTSEREYERSGIPVHLTDEEKGTIHDNIEQNIISLAEKYPEVTFYCFMTPYSAAWWEAKVADGTIYKQIEAEQCVIEQCLECQNIKLFSFNNRTDITTDLNNYKDTMHYGSWINSLILKWMYNDQYLLTKENYMSYLTQELLFYTSYDYGFLYTQEDYENDYFAEALLNLEFSGTEPMEILPDFLDECELENADIVVNPYDGILEIECRGSLQRASDSEISVGDYLMDSEYAGIKVPIDEIAPYKYIVFYGKKNMGYGQPSVYIYNENNEVETSYMVNWYEIDGEEYQYLVDVSELTGKVTIIFNGAYIDNTGDEKSSYLFRDIMLY